MDQISIQDDDYELEEFYFYFKKSMINFYNNHSFSRPIEIWSNNLNNLKKQKKYQDIQKLIIKIMSLYAIDLMRVGDEYNSNILNTNINRFNTIVINNKKMIVQIEKNVIFLLFDIFNYFIKKDAIDFKKYFTEIELYIIYNNFDNLIEFSYTNKYYKVLDLLFNYCNKTYLKFVNNHNICLKDTKTPMSSIKLIATLEKN